MGAINSRALTHSERDLDWQGKLNATIGGIWEVKSTPYAGSYNQALGLRRHQKPEMYDRLLDYARQHMSAAEAGDLMKEWLTQTTASTVVAPNGDLVETVEIEHKDKTKTKSSVEPFTQPENDAHKHLMTFLGGLNRSRAHLMPNDIECRKFWGKIAELVSGAEIEPGDVWFRALLVDIMKDFRVNLLVFDGGHAEFFDNLKRGVLLAIPLLVPERLAKWKHREPYEFLIVCDSPEAYLDFSRSTESKNVQWATTEDIDLATTVLTETSKILADSLDSHWVDYFSQQGNSSEIRIQQLSHLKDLLRENGEVLVPNVRYTASSKLHYGATGLVKVMKVNLGMVYKGDYAAYIPDPWLLAFKSASNWSAFAYPSFRGKRLKLAPACSCDDSESSHPAVITLTSSHIRGLCLDKKRRQDKEIIGTELEDLEGDDFDAVSALSEKSTDFRLVSDD